jgi:hypothetical protein
MIGEVKAQLQTYLNGATPATTFQSIENKMLPYLDSLKLVTDSAVYYSGSGEYKPYQKFRKIWGPRLGANGTFGSFYSAQANFYNELQSNYNYITEAKWSELGPKKLNFIQGSTGIGPVEAITFFDNGTVESTRYMLASSLMGGLFFSENYGETWVNGGTDVDPWVQSGCSWAVFHPTDYNTWFASSSGNGTSGQSLWIGNGGIYRTTNKGEDWVQIANHVDLNGHITTIYKLLIDPADTNVLFAATSRGIFRTTNCNAVATPENPDPVIWQKVCDYFSYDLEMKPGDHNVLYAACYTDASNGWQLWRSVDNGLHFYSMPAQPGFVADSDPKKSSFTIEVSKAKPDFLYADVRLSNNHSFYYYDFSVNTNWITIKTGVSSAMGWGHGFGVDQAVNGERLIVCGGVGSIRLTGFYLDGSSLPVGYPVHVDAEDVVFHPYNANEVWSCTHGGVEKSVNGGQTWLPKYEGLGVAMVEQMATAYTDPGLMLIGLMHDGVQLTQTPYQKDWNPDWEFLRGFNVDGMMPLIDHKNPQHMWGSGQWGMWLYSANGFDTVSNISYKPTYWETRGVLNKSNPDIFYRNGIRTGSCEDVTRSSNMNSVGQYDKNDYISDFKAAIPNAYYLNILGLKTSFSNPDYLVAMFCTKVDPNNENEIAVFHIFRTTNANAEASAVTWSELTIPRTSSISGIEFDPNNPDIIYLSYSKSANDIASERMIYKIDYTNPNLPDTTDITKNLPVVPSYDNSIAVQRGSNGGLYFATEFGVFYTDNDLLQQAGNEWRLVGKELPHVIPHGLELNYVSNTLRVGTYGRGVWEIPLPCINNADPLLITQNTTWDSYMRLDRSVKVGYMTTLTITENARIAMPADAKIIVEPGGKLIVNGGTITSGCDYPWQGIEVWGNSAQHQWPNSNGTYMQGYVELNDATIENAICALSLWKPGDYSKTGGMVFATNTVFRNNEKSAHALLYRNFHPVNGKEMEYNSWFNNCTFEITEDYFGIHRFYKHVDLNQVNGIKFRGCDFSVSSEAPAIADFNQAIAGYNAGFKVEAICNSMTLPCPENEYDRSTFTGFYSAIYSGSGMLSSYPFTVNRADFNGNSIGIEVNGVTRQTILFNNFSLGTNAGDAAACTTGASSFGIDMAGSNSFIIEENTFAKDAGAPQGLYVGIRCKDSKTPIDVIYRNSFNGLSYGNRAEGLNRQNPLQDQNGLQFMCNTNQNNAIDFIVAKTNSNLNPMIHGSQGSLNLEAGNTFSANPLPEGNFKNEGKQYVNYFYHTNPPVYHTDTLVVPIYITTTNTCPSNYGGIIPKSIVLDESQKLQREIDFATNLADFNNVKALFDNLKDGGNTEGLKMEVTSSWPEDMWELRAKLLGDSPHLSEEVLKAAADKTDVLPESVLFEILSANPDELRKESLIEYLENKEQPLPAYMISILKQLAGGITYKTVLMQDMARYEGEKTKAANDLIRSCLNDTYIDWEYVRNWYDNLNTLNADYGIVASYMTEKNYSAATTMLDIIPAVRELEGNDLEEYTACKNLLLWQIQLEQQGGDITGLDTIAINMLQETAEGSTGMASLMARAVLEYGQGYHFGKCLPEADQALYKSGTTGSGKFDTGVSVTANPNPAHSWVAFDYSLPVTIRAAELFVTDVQGRLVVSFALSGSQGQQVWDTRQVEKGVYVYTLKAGTVRKQGKLVIQ